MAKVLIFFIHAYRYLIRPFLPPACRFYPSCSQYAKDALLNYNVPWAVLLIVLRLLKCHPLHPGGFDPLPENPTRAAHAPGHPAPRTP